VAITHLPTGFGASTLILQDFFGASGGCGLVEQCEIFARGSREKHPFKVKRLF
jgi:hypothetical protein